VEPVKQQSIKSSCVSDLPWINSQLSDLNAGYY
jgi:hypothetical protein